jgi:hypothetical protein
MRLVTRPMVVVAITVFVTDAQSELWVTVMVVGVQVDRDSEVIGGSGTGNVRVVVGVKDVIEPVGGRGGTGKVGDVVYSETSV